MTASSWLADPLLHLNGTGPSHKDAFRAATEAKQREHLRVHHTYGDDYVVIAYQADTLPAGHLVAAHAQFHITQDTPTESRTS
jgi:hypothetical protein